MNDVNGLSTESLADVNSPVAKSSSPGAILRNAREAAGVSINALATAMKVSATKLEGLEADNYTTLPDVVFARALAASICRVFGIASGPVLALMPKSSGHQLSSASSDINATFKDGSERPRRNSLVSQITRPLGVAVVVLLLGAAVFVLLPYRSDTPESANQGTATYEVGMKEAPLELTSPVEALPGSPVLQSQVPVSEVLQEFAVTQVLNEAEQGRPQAAVAGQGTNSVLEFSARGPSWVQVRDASKKIVLERNLLKGESAFATGSLPLSVVVGRADAIDVKVRGAIFELSDVAKSNVARFEVK